MNKYLYMCAAKGKGLLEEKERGIERDNESGGV